MKGKKVDTISCLLDGKLGHYQWCRLPSIVHQRKFAGIHKYTSYRQISVQLMMELDEMTIIFNAMRKRFTLVF